MQFCVTRICSATNWNWPPVTLPWQLRRQTAALSERGEFPASQRKSSCWSELFTLNSLNSTSFTHRITLLSSDYPGCTHIILTYPGERGRSFNGVLRVKNAVSQRFPKPLPPHLLQPFRTQLTPTCPPNTVISPKHSARWKHLNFQLTAPSIVP